MPAAKKIRKDPVTRPINAGSPYFELTSPQPDRKYVWVYKAAPEHGVEYYEAIGYTPVQYRRGGVKARVGKMLKPGNFVESRGHILMECTAERAEEIYQFGEDGNSGQAAADVIERKMYNSKKAIAELSARVPMRSSHGSDYFSLEAEKGSVALAAGDD